MDKKAFVKTTSNAHSPLALDGQQGAQTYTIHDIRNGLMHRPREREPPRDALSSQVSPTGDPSRSRDSPPHSGRSTDQSSRANSTHSNSSANDAVPQLPSASDDHSSVSSLEEVEYQLADSSAFRIGMMIDDQMDILPYGPDESHSLDYGNIDIQDGLGHGYQPSYHNSAFPNHASPARFVDKRPDDTDTQSIAHSEGGVSTNWSFPSRAVATGTQHASQEGKKAAKADPSPARWKLQQAVEVYSGSAQKWCLGEIKSISDNGIQVQYRVSDDCYNEKTLSPNSSHIRAAQQQEQSTPVQKRNESRIKTNTPPGQKTTRMNGTHNAYNHPKPSPRDQQHHSGNVSSASPTPRSTQDFRKIGGYKSSGPRSPMEQKFNVGDYVQVAGRDGKDGRGNGTVRYVGTTHRHGSKILYGVELERSHPKCGSGRIDEREYFPAARGKGTFCQDDELRLTSRPQSSRSNDHNSLAVPDNSLYAGLILAGLPAVLTDDDDFLLSMNSAVLENNAMHIDVHDSGDLEITLQDSRALRKIGTLIEAAMAWVQSNYPSHSLKKVSGKPVKRRKRRYTGAVNQSDNKSAGDSEQLQTMRDQISHLNGRQLERLTWMELKAIEEKIRVGLKRVESQKRELVKSWNEDDVCKWLRFNETIHREYSNVFKREGIDGEMLFDLTQQVLKEDFGIKKSMHRKRILDEITKLQHEIGAGPRNSSNGSVGSMSHHGIS